MILSESTEYYVGVAVARALNGGHVLSYAHHGEALPSLRAAQGQVRVLVQRDEFAHRVVAANEYAAMVVTTVIHDGHAAKL